MTPVLAHVAGATSAHGHAFLSAGTAAVILGTGVLVVIGFRLEDRAPNGARRWVQPGAIPRVLAAALSLGAAAIHFSVIGVHAAVDPVEGILFALAAWLQLVAGVAVLLTPDRRALAGLAAVNLAAGAAWLWSRTLGIPFGEDAWIPQGVGPADGLATAFEVLAVVVATLPSVASRRATPGPRTRLSSAVTYVGAAVLAIAVATTVVLVGYPPDDHASAPAATIPLP